MTRTARSVGAGLLVAAAAFVLTGCTPGTPEPTPVVVQQVIWPDGEPAGELEASPWVVAARSAAIATATAENAANFDFAELEDSSTMFWRSRLYKDAIAAAEHGEHVPTRPGPKPFAPLTLEVAPDGESADLRVCEARQWSLDAEGDAPAKLELTGAEYRLKRGSDGSYRLDAIVGVPALDCASADPAIGLFDPLPEPSEVIGEDRIVAPKSSADEDASDPQ